MPQLPYDQQDAERLSRHPGVYAVEWTRMGALMKALEHQDAAAGRGQERPYEMAAPRVAVVPIAGPMVKGFSWYGTSSVLLKRAVQEAAADRKVDAIVLHIDSPGGMVPGTQELADAVAAARQVKPVHAYIDDLGASAAYWVASQAETITANRTAEVGSIGVLAVAMDLSGMVEKVGVKVHVVSTGPYKGAFVPGAPVPDEHVEYLQERVDETMGHFQAAITSGRPGLSGKALERVSDGRVWGAAQAVEYGLIDGVGSFESLVRRVAGEVEGIRARRRAALARASVLRSSIEALE